MDLCTIPILENIYPALFDSYSTFTVNFFVDLQILSYTECMQNSTSQRIDVIIQLQKMIEMMSRIQGASIKEICNELECNERTFYRRKEDLIKMDVPVYCKGDPDAVTSTKRWYVDRNYNQEPVTIFLTPAEKILLRKMIFKKTYSSNMEEKLCEKINKAILCDTNTQTFQIGENQLDNSELLDSDEILTTITNALENHYILEMSSYYTEGQILGLEEKIDFTRLFFEPYTFLQENDSLWIIGKLHITRKIPEIYNPEKEKIIAIYVNAIGNAKRLADYRFEIPQDYDSKEWIKKLFKTENQFKITFNAEQTLVDKLLRKKWFNDIEVNYLFDRQVFTISVSDIQKTKEMILSYGSSIKVLEPENFAKEIEAELNKARLQYSKELLLPPFTSSKSITLKEDDASISYGKHKTNNALYRYYNTWWRLIINLNHKDITEWIFNLNDADLSGPIHNIFIPDGKLRSEPDKMYAMAIPFKEQIFLEYPQKKEIKGDFSWLNEVYDILTNSWWDEEKKCHLRYILNRNEEWKSSESYKKNPPKILLTGVDDIDPNIAKEITEQGTLNGVPCAALVIKNKRNNDGTCTITSYFYNK